MLYWAVVMLDLWALQSHSSAPQDAECLQVRHKKMAAQVKKFSEAWNMTMSVPRNDGA